MTTNTPVTASTLTSAAKQPSKSAAVVRLLTRARGATIAEIQAATDWQPHSVRAYLSGLRKAGRPLDKEERKSGETSYRLGTVLTAAALPSTPGTPVPAAADASTEAST